MIITNKDKIITKRDKMVATKIRTLRNAKGYSQEYVAAKLKISQNTYSKIESGQTRLTLDRVKQIAELYEVEPDFFFQNEASIVNYNNGTYSKAVANIYTETYHESSNISEETRQLIEDQRAQIKFLMDELENCRKERIQFLSLISSIKGSNN